MIQAKTSNTVTVNVYPTKIFYIKVRQSRAFVKYPIKNFKIFV